MQAEVEQQLLPPAPGADCVPSVALGHLTPEFNANHDASFGAAHSHLRRKTLIASVLSDEHFASSRSLFLPCRITPPYSSPSSAAPLAP